MTKMSSFYAIKWWIQGLDKLRSAPMPYWINALCFSQCSWGTWATNPLSLSSNREEGHSQRERKKRINTRQICYVSKCRLLRTKVLSAVCSFNYFFVEEGLLDIAKRLGCQITCSAAKYAMAVTEGFELEIELELRTMVTPHLLPHVCSFLAHCRPEDSFQPLW